MDLLALLSTGCWLLGLVAVLVALHCARRCRDAHGWLLVCWGFLCLSLLLGR